MIWPMSQMKYAPPSTSVGEIREALRMLKIGSAGSGFIHESYFKNDPRNFTRAWFAWANSLFGELIGHLAEARPEVLKG